MSRQRRQTLIACACAVLAVVAVFAYTASIKSEAAMARSAAIHSYGGERVQVVVASQDIPVGQTIQADGVQMQEWLVDLLPRGQAATALDQVQGKTAQVDIKANEPLLLERVGDGVSRVSVPQGLAAVTVSSDEVNAVGGAIKAGSFVDVYVEQTKGGVSLLGSKILVLETSNAQEGDDAQLTWVTLAVTPESVSELITASTDGTIHFSLPSGTASKEG